MDHRSLRRKIMEEMWDNTDSMKSEEQAMLWLIQLKEDIRRILEGLETEPESPNQSKDDDCDAEDTDWLPSNALKEETKSPSQSSVDDMADNDEERDREVREWMASDELEISPDKNTAGHHDKHLLPPSIVLGRHFPASTLLHGLKGVSVRAPDNS
ncbi:hypothetical protein UPYG_G00055480 [Umbra pygmaea]|uniref:Uncharacterized protein n=1 Tax=Umbra pygmaea TaxID=75934 RepID=A0ABD0XN95_UMBPY